MATIVLPGYNVVMFTPQQRPMRYNPAGEAKAREQKRQAEAETEVKNRALPAFMFQGYGFRPQYGVTRGTLRLDGPLCPKTSAQGETCFADLVGESEKTTVACDVCGFTGELPQPFQRFREIAHKKYEGHQRYVESGGNIETLDVPYEAIKEKSEDETRRIKIKWAQKDGRNTAVVYFIEKGEKNGAKAQVFADLDRKELRHDASDVNPEKILARITAEFPEVKSEITYNKPAVVLEENDMK